MTHGTPDLSDVRTAARTALGSDPEQVRPIERGHAARVYDVRANGREAVLKLYADPQRHEWLRVVAPTVDRVRRSDVPAPRVLGHGRCAGGTWVAYERLHGVGADQWARLPERVWERVGACTARVNALDAPGYGRIHYGIDGSPLYFRSWRSFIAPEIDRLTRPASGFGPFDDARAAVRRRLEDLAGWRFEPRVVHANITGSNLVVDPETGALHGVIDWEEMMFARVPHFELATALLWLDPRARAAFLAGYGCSEAEYATIRRDVETARLLYLTRYLLWHRAIGNEAMLTAVWSEMRRILL